MSPRPRVLPLLVLMALLAGACRNPEVPAIELPPTASPTAVPTPTPSTAFATATPAPFEDEPGLTAGVMRVAVIADGDTPDLAADGSESVWQAIEAWAETVNDRGGLANRSIEISRIDSAVLRSADAIDLVCNGDFFAIVGSVSLIDDEGLSQLRSPDCRLPDFPAQASSLARLESSTTFVSNPVTASTWNAGFARYFADAHPEGAAAAATVLVNFRTLVVGGEQMIEATSAQGYNFVYRPVVEFGADYEAIAQDIVQAGARSLTWRNNSRDLMTLLAALDAIQSPRTFDFINCGLRCYDQAWVEEAGEDLADGVSVWLPTLPREEADLNAELLRYLSTLQDLYPDSAEPSGLGVLAWSAALLFEEAVNRAVGAGTAEYDPNALTRAGVINAASTITEWTAHGLHGPSNPAEGTPSACFLVVTRVDGAWQRTYPTRRGAFDCDVANLVELEVTAGAGAEPLPSPTPLPAP
jgi:hypothetical protein